MTLLLVAKKIREVHVKMWQQHRILLLDIGNQIPTDGKCLSSHIFATLEHFSQNKEYNVIEWLLLYKLKKVEKLENVLRASKPSSNSALMT